MLFSHCIYLVLLFLLGASDHVLLASQCHSKAKAPLPISKWRGMSVMGM